MLQNEILDEIHKIREEHAKTFNYDLDAMFADWQQRQAESGREVVNLSANRSLTIQMQQTAVMTQIPEEVAFYEKILYAIVAFVNCNCTRKSS